MDSASFLYAAFLSSLLRCFLDPFFGLGNAWFCVVLFLFWLLCRLSVVFSTSLLIVSVGVILSLALSIYVDVFICLFSVCPFLFLCACLSFLSFSWCL